MHANTATCGGCGKTAPRDDMFGLEPDLRCPACAAGVRERMQVRRRFVLRERRPIATVGLLAVSAVLFLITDVLFRRSADPSSTPPTWVLDLYQDGPIWLGAWWRHATSTFVHGGLFHVAMNGFALWQLGRLIESGWGHVRLVTLMIATGVGASAIAWVFSAPGTTVGISGGIFGVVGFVWALGGHHPLATAIANQRFKNWIMTFFVVCLVLTYTGTFPISNSGHAAGFVLGFALGLVARHRDRLVEPAALVLLVGAILIGQLVTFGSTPYFTVKATGADVARSTLRAQVVRGERPPWLGASWTQARDAAWYRANAPELPDGS